MWKKAKTFSKEEFDKFVGSVELVSPYCHVRKVIMIVGYFDGLHHTKSLLIENFVSTQEGVIVTHCRAKVSFKYLSWCF